MTAAAALRLWTPDTDVVHVAVSHSASRLEAGTMRLHRAVGPAPVVATTPVDPIVNILFHVARCLVPADALAVWESALHHRLADADTLARVSWRSVRAAELAAAASSLSDSGIETRFTVIMREIGVRVLQQIWIDGHPVDHLIGERLVAQIDGFAHHRQARDRRRDIQADARLQLRGYTVLRFDWYQILFQPEYVRDTILMAIAQGLHLAR